jgi:hypothetical protein
MSNRQVASYWEGNRAELFSTYVLSSVAAVSPVHRPFDFGIDLLCTLTHRREHCLYAGRSFGVQVKSGQEREFQYGGLDEKKKIWKRHEVEWLYGQGQPFLVSTVSLKERRVQIYSPSPMWWLRWKVGWPGEVVLTPDALKGASPDKSASYPRVRLPLDADGHMAGDGFRYVVPLGRPIVDIVLDEEDSEEHREHIRACLDKWLALESSNIRHYQMRVPFTQEYLDWAPNEIPTSQTSQHYLFNDTPDQNVPEILESIGPSVAALYHNFRIQGQGERLSDLQSIVRLLQDYGALDSSAIQQVERNQRR